MKITNDDIKKWFPRNNRFLHFCAKYYGLTFYSDEVVEHAAYLAFKNIKRYMDRDEEFENEKQKIGMAMSAFRFGILNAYNTYQNANRRNLDARTESELTYGYDGDEYSVYQSNLISHDKPYDNSTELLREFIESNLPYLQRKVIIDCFFNGKGYTELANELEISRRKVELAKYRAFTKIKEYYKQQERNEDRYKEPTNNKKYIPASHSKLRAETLSKPNDQEQGREVRYSEAMSFIHSSQEI
jgi:RNA polymerase sigma factor (sigma-70 family)